MESQHGLEVHHVYQHSIRGFAFAGNAKAAQALARNPRIAYVEQDQFAHTSEAAIPSGVSRIGIDAPLLNAISPAGANVEAQIAIIDTGLQRNHPDLNVDSGGVRVITKTVKGKTQITFDSIFDDDNGHGTHVGGTAAANGAIVGVAPGALLTAVKVLSAGGSGPWSYVIAGVDWVAGQPDRFDVANMSLGGGYSQAVNDAVKLATDKGIVFVVSAGNASSDISQVSPASELSAITVSAMVDYDGVPGGLGSGDYVSCKNSDGTGGTLHSDEAFACFSNYGEGVDICAPGVRIYSTWPQTLGDLTGYHTISGTSMAAPHVAGAAALYTALNRASRTQTKAWVDDVTAALTSSGWRVGDYGYFDYYTADTALPRPTGDKDSIREPLLNVSSLLGVSVRPDIAVTISTPADGNSFAAGEFIGFTATASSDTEDLTDAIVWTSSRDGALGSGGSISTTLSEGTHTIVASAPDSTSTFGGVASITVISGSPTPTPKQLFVTITFDKSGKVPVYYDGETMRSYFVVTDELGTPVPEALVSAAIKNPLNYTLGTASGATDADGGFEAYRKMNSKRDGGTGNYTITGSATKTGYLPSAEVRRSFELSR
jgi:subtilisin family serine protease